MREIPRKWERGMVPTILDELYVETPMPARRIGPEAKTVLGILVSIRADEKVNVVILGYGDGWFATHWAERPESWRTASGSIYVREHAIEAELPGLDVAIYRLWRRGDST
jgi:hypothetical protein